MSKSVLLLSLLWSLVEVHSQTFPYISFNGTTLVSHSYVDLSLVGNDPSGSDSFQCHTDLSTCCSGGGGGHRGDWYFPNGTRLPFNAPDVVTYEFRWAQRVDIRRRNSGTNSSTGIYRCDIPTVAVHHDTDTSVRESVYVGLYTANGGDVAISGDIVYSDISDLNGASPQFTLACISTGGPATTVTWTRDSTTVTQGTETVLNDPVTAQYTHTLTVTGRLPGLYNCTVANNKPSNASVTRVFTLEAPTNAPEMFKTVAGERHVVFSWSPHVTHLHRAIDNYTLSCSPSPSFLPQSPSSQSGSLTATGFSPNTLYSCSLTPNNLLGSGPPARATFTTKLGYTYFQLRLKGVLPCTEVIATLTEQKLEDVGSAVVEQLEALCAECASENINRQSFSCFEESPSFLTYRARLEGTSDTDSGSLIPLIEAWVRGGGASVIVAGVLMTIDANCSVAISSPSEPECSYTPPPSTDAVCSSSNNTPSVVAGVVVAIVVIVIAVTTVIFTTIVWKIRQGGGVPTKINEKPYNIGSNRAYETKAPQQEYEPVENDTGKVPTTNKGSHKATLPETTTEDESYEVTLPPIRTSSHGAAEDDMNYETIPAEN